MTDNKTNLAKTLGLRISGAMNPAIHDSRWYGPLVPGGVVTGSNKSGQSTVSFDSTSIKTDYTCWEVETRVHNVAEVEIEIDKLVALSKTVFLERLEHTPMTNVKVEFGHRYANEGHDFPQLLTAKFPVFNIRKNESGPTFFALWEASESVAETTLQSRMWACNKSWHLHFSHIFDFDAYGRLTDDFNLAKCLCEVEMRKRELIDLSDSISNRVVQELGVTT